MLFTLPLPLVILWGPILDLKRISISSSDYYVAFLLAFKKRPCVSLRQAYDFLLVFACNINIGSVGISWNLYNNFLIKDKMIFFLVMDFGLWKLDFSRLLSNMTCFWLWYFFLCFYQYFIAFIHLDRYRTGIKFKGLRGYDKFFKGSVKKFACTPDFSTSIPGLSLWNNTLRRGSSSGQCGRSWPTPAGRTGTVSWTRGRGTAASIAGTPYLVPTRMQFGSG